MMKKLAQRTTSELTFSPSVLRSVCGLEAHGGSYGHAGAGGGVHRDGEWRQAYRDQEEDAQESARLKQAVACL